MPIARTNLVIPENYVSEIIKSTVEQSSALSLLRRINLGTKVTHLPVMSALPVGGWVSGDSGIKPQTQAAWEGVTLTVEELAAIVTVPEAVIDDANFDIFGEIQPAVSAEFGRLIDLAVLFGAGAPATFPTGGIFQHAHDAAQRVHRGDSVAPAADIAGDVNLTMAKVEDVGFEVTGFAARSGLKSAFRGLRASTGELIFQPSLQAATPPNLYGEDITFSRNAGWDATKADLIAGDWSKGIVGIRQDMNVKVLTEATFTDGAGNVVTSLAETDQVALRCYMRLGFAIANPVTQLHTDKATRSPWAVLQPTGAA